MNTATNPKGEKLIVLTEAEYLALSDDAGDIADAAAARLADAGAPTLEGDALRAVLEGRMHPLTAWRKAAGLSQAALSQRSGVRTATINEIEGGKVDPRISTVKAIADALGVDIDDIVA